MAKKDKNEENVENIENQEDTAKVENLDAALDAVAENSVGEVEAVNTDTALNGAPDAEVTENQPAMDDAVPNNDDTVSLDVDIDNDENTKTEEPVTVQAVKFASFEDAAKPATEQNKNLDILMDIKLQLTVELGRTELPVKKVLELTRGSIVELQKVAGEPVELYANGKLVAQGEVVVIEDNFGLRITGITDPEDRLKGL